MRRLTLFAAAIVILACKGSTDPSSAASPYRISVLSSPHSGGHGTPYVTSITLLVVDTGTSNPHPGVGVTLQVDGGQITSPLPNITGPNGQTVVVWSIDTVEQTPGTVYSLGYCAVSPGQSHCRTSLIGTQVITTDPF